MKNNLYLAVDYDGTEKASNSPLVRPSELYRKQILTHFFTKGTRRRWMDTWVSSVDELPLLFCGTILPKGTIEKLTGKKLKWTDEPIIFKI